MSEKFVGVVKWYNEQKGFGFIEQSSGRDLFVHYKEVRGKLNQGDKVEYVLGEAKQGPCACKVKILESTVPAADKKSE
ncbi:MAG: cold shock domain-containing protein [Bdellovibrionota bacterium]